MSRRGRFRLTDTLIAGMTRVLLRLYLTPDCPLGPGKIWEPRDHLVAGNG